MLESPYTSSEENLRPLSQQLSVGEVMREARLSCEEEETSPGANIGAAAAHLDPASMAPAEPGPAAPVECIDIDSGSRLADAFGSNSLFDRRSHFKWERRRQGGRWS